MPRKRVRTSPTNWQFQCCEMAALVGVGLNARELAANSRLDAFFVSNRCFPTKAMAIWEALDRASHAKLVERYLRDARTWAGRDLQPRLSIGRQRSATRGCGPLNEFEPELEVQAKALRRSARANQRTNAQIAPCASRSASPQ